MPASSRAGAARHRLPESRQTSVLYPHFLQMLKCIGQIFRILSRLSPPLHNQPGLIVSTELACILVMRAVHHKAQSINFFRKCVFISRNIDEMNTEHDFMVNLRDLFARAQILKHLGRLTRLHPIRQSSARSPAIQSQHKSRAFGRPTVDMAENTKSPVVPVKLGRAPLGIVKSRPPHQRAIGKNPKILHINPLQASSIYFDSAGMPKRNCSLY